ncbi:MAG: hypothetical protein QM658_06380, partial [Gordonia sp. (in: high G+C Gram-positive bacteria)]
MSTNIDTKEKNMNRPSTELVLVPRAARAEDENTSPRLPVDAAPIKTGRVGTTRAGWILVWTGTLLASAASGTGAALRLDPGNAAARAMAIGIGAAAPSVGLLVRALTAPLIVGVFGPLR